MSASVPVASVPVAQAQTVNAAHPRVWLTPSRLTRLQDYARRNTARWQNVKAAADTALAATTLDQEQIPPLALVYQVTRDTRYARKAITILLSVAVASNDLTENSSWDYRITLPDVTAGYDWCYDQMTAPQRRQVAGWLMDRADQVWPETNPARIGAWG